MITTSIYPLIILFCALAINSYIDYKKKLIYPIFVSSFTILGIAIQIYFAYEQQNWNMVLNFISGMVALAIFGGIWQSKKILNSGDTEMLVCVGALMPAFCDNTLWLSLGILVMVLLFTLSAVGICLRNFNNTHPEKVKIEEIPFIPFIFLAVIISLMIGALI